MKKGIDLRVSNWLDRKIVSSGDNEWQNGITSIRIDSDSTGDGVKFYIQNKGFGSSSTKSVTSHLGNDDIKAMMVFFANHLSLSKDVEIMRDAYKAANPEEVIEDAPE